MICHADIAITSGAIDRTACFSVSLAFVTYLLTVRMSCLPADRAGVVFDDVQLKLAGRHATYRNRLS